MPWITYTHISHTNSGKKDNATPLFDWGKYYEKDGRIVMPISVQAHHSFVDGIHMGQFADMLQNVRKPAQISNPTEDRMVNYASRFLGTRYRLGASGPSAFDCSGFTSYVYKNFGITLNRSSRSQFLQGEKVSVNNLRPGDLMFFSSRSAGRGNVGHVAMVVSVDPANGTCKFIHASVKHGVTYQSFPDNGYYSRNFLGARRILGTSLDATAQASK